MAVFPSIPLVDPWAALSGSEVTATAMTNNITVPFNEIQTFLFSSPAYFYAYLGLAGTYSNGVNMQFGTSPNTIVEDNVSGWVAGTSHNYVVKSAGLYLIQLQTVAGATTAYPIPLLNKGGTLLNAPGQAAAPTQSGGGSFSITLRLAVNDTIAMQLNQTYTSHASVHASFMALTQLSRG